MNWRLLFKRIGIRNLLVAGVLAVGGTWLFLGVLEDVVSGDPLVAVDVRIHAALQSIRFPLLDSLMVAASELGDGAVTIPVILVVLAWLVWQWRLRSATYWILAAVFAQVFVVTLKLAMRRARPSSMYEGLQGFSFPSNHATLSVVTYGFLAFFVARAWGNVARLRIATATALFILLISFSRLYLGVHWFSDVLAGISFGVAWIATAAVLHRVGDENERDASSLGVASFVTFVISATVHIIMQHGVDMTLYAPR
jgi:undecaprenyl-diphosphatase